MGDDACPRHGCRRPNANLSGANLSGADLADIIVTRNGLPTGTGATFTGATIAGWLMRGEWFCGTTDLFGGALGTLPTPSPASWSWVESGGQWYLRAGVLCQVWFSSNSTPHWTSEWTSQSALGANNLAPNTFTKAGYSFAGWNTYRDGSGTPYADQASFDFVHDAPSLFAQWVPSSDARPEPAPEPGRSPAPSPGAAEGPRLDPNPMTSAEAPSIPASLPAHSPMSTIPGPSPVTNGTTPRAISASVSLVGAATAEATTKRFMRNPPSTRIGRAPKVRASAGRPVSIVVTGLEADQTYTMQLRSSGGYTTVGSLAATQAGELHLPVSQFDRPGTYALALVPPSGPTRYVKVVAR